LFGHILAYVLADGDLLERKQGNKGTKIAALGWVGWQWLLASCKWCHHGHRPLILLLWN